MSDSNRVHWEDDGSSANRPVPDWWEATELREIGGRLVFSFHEGSEGRKEVVTDAGRLAEIAARMGVGDDDLAEAMRVLDGEHVAPSMRDLAASKRQIERLDQFAAAALSGLAAGPDDDPAAVADRVWKLAHAVEAARLPAMMTAMEPEVSG